MRGARGHSAATLCEAAQSELRVGSGERVDPDIVVHPAIRAAWPGVAVAGPAFTVQGAGGDNLVLHAEITHSGHWPMYFDAAQMWPCITQFVNRTEHP